jgi:hypothetical protein
LFNVAGMHVVDVVHDVGSLLVTVESDRDVGACPACGVVAVGHGRRVHSVADAPCFGVPVLSGRPHVSERNALTEQRHPFLTYSAIRLSYRLWRCPPMLGGIH